MVWVNLIEEELYDRVSIFHKVKQVIINRNIDVLDKSIFFKVSFVFPVRDPKRVEMIITNPIFIVGVSQAFIDAGAKAVYIGDAETFACSHYAFEVVEIKKEVKKLPKDVRKKIKFCYLDEMPKEILSPDKPFLPGIEFDYPNIVKEVDLFISLPKLKVNIFADVTLSVKNNMGLLSKPYRLKYHSNNLHELIADIYQIRQPDYVITDAILAGEGQGPMEASSYPTNLIIFGNNGPAVDLVCCHLMGYNPLSIKHLKYLIDANYGPSNLEEIDLETLSILENHKHSFIRPISTLTDLCENITVFSGECCSSGCLPFLRALLDGYGLRKGWENVGDLTLIYGKNLVLSQSDYDRLKSLSKKDKKKVLVYGNCVKKYKDLGIFYSGCPPDYIRSLMTFPFKNTIGFSPWINYVEKRTFVFSMLQSAFRKLFRIYPRIQQK